MVTCCGPIGYCNDKRKSEINTPELPRRRLFVYIWNDSGLKSKYVPSVLSFYCLHRQIFKRSFKLGIHTCGILFAVEFKNCLLKLRLFDIR